MNINTTTSFEASNIALILNTIMKYVKNKISYFPVGKIVEKAVCSSVFLTIWRINKNALFQTAFSAILSNGFSSVKFSFINF